jgi:hypothetical protein
MHEILEPIIVLHYAGLASTGGCRTLCRVSSAPWDWNGIVATGQSLGVGGSAPELIATRPSPGNLKLSLGSSNRRLPFDPDAPELTMVPLCEPIRPLAENYPSAYPWNIWGETPHTAMANQVSALVAADTDAGGGGTHVTVHTVVGEAGQGMAVIRRGAVYHGPTGRAYAASMFEVAAIRRLAAAAGKSYGVGAVVLTHGETDCGDPNYERDVVALAADYDRDLRLLTGQAGPIPMLISQQQGAPSQAGTCSPSTLAQWTAARRHPGAIVCVGPKYQYGYHPDALHLTADGYDRYGEKLGQVYHQVVVRGRAWQPLAPVEVARSGRVVTVRFHVPVPPLVWDESIPAPHQDAFTAWRAGRGFELRGDEDTPLPIAAVEIVGADTVRITCGVDLHARLLVAYAMTSDGQGAPGHTFRGGQLADSDACVGATTGRPQRNFCVSFEQDVL